jgi:5-formyltetrahydrofolate cyclo-ligase
MDETFASTDDSADSRAFPVASHGALRAAIRQCCIAERLALAAQVQEHQEKSALIEQHLWAWFATRAPGRFSFCAAIRGEFDCAPLALRLMSLGWHAAMAVADKPASALEFRHWAPEVPMQNDRYGIPVPQSEIVPTPDVLLIPMIAFDAQGYRLGYGGGYFDRTLAHLSASSSYPIAVGIGFAQAQVDSVLPQAHDQRMTMVVTEAGLWQVPSQAQPVAR